MTSGGLREAREFRVPFPTSYRMEREEGRGWRREVSSQTHLVPLQTGGLEWASGSCPGRLVVVAGPGGPGDTQAGWGRLGSIPGRKQDGVTPRL